MPILKCKMCGGALDVSENSTIVECEYCGSAQTLPKLDDEKKLSLFDRANHYRLNNEFDKASVIYENIIAEEPNEAEAYWGICLCRYGIEYVVDPSTQKRIPTCHRAQYTSILEDKDYLSAINNADLLAKEVYQQEAEYIDKVQKSILEISAKEEPFDIFICYKETDDQGERTVDSVIAQELYDDLTEAGHKVFFARITLEDKLGSAYEPYIFAALNSAKVMLVIGSKSEYFNAVWVKNEWSRYLSLIAQGKKKTIIPCYRDISPYELPKELSHLQSQDVSKVGWKQDLLRGLNKILCKEGKINKATKNTISELSVEDGLYIGDAIAGKPHGQGKCQYKNGIIYDGQWSFGKWNGMGICTYPSGSKYEGVFVDGKFNGEGTFYYSDGKKWSGEWKDDSEWTGSGFIQYEHGMYEGSLVDGKWHGEGLYVYDNGEQYKGLYNNGKREGSGTLTYANGKSWSGEWKNDSEWNGTGYIRYDVGYYEGQVENGEWSGLGVYQFDNGELYEGNHKKGKREGQGKVTYADKKTWSGIWKNDMEDTGSGYIKFENGYYEGELRNGDRYGQGVFNHNNGAKWSGEWKNDSEWNGFGSIVYKAGKYNGHIENGKWEGEGEYIYNNGSKYQGNFHDNLMHGTATYTTKEGKKWVGEYANDKKWNGSGYIKCDNGYYDGEMVEGRFSGKGKRVYDDKSYYEGHFAYDQYEGEGVYYYSNGSSLSGDSWSGIWSKGTFLHGSGTMLFPEGKYIGECKDGLRNGNGTFTWYAGVVTVDERNTQLKERWTDTPSLKGVWKNGEFWEGYGSSYFADGRYTGYWKNGKRNGQGTYSWSQRNAQTWSGEWKDDMPWNGDGYWRCKEFFESHYTLKNGRMKQGCYIATCVYGSYDCPQVWTLRRFRDECLSKYCLGRWFIKKYYEISPKIVARYGESKFFRNIFIKPLDIIVRILIKTGYSDEPYND